MGSYIIKSLFLTVVICIAVNEFLVYYDFWSTYWNTQSLFHEVLVHNIKLENGVLTKQQLRSKFHLRKEEDIIQKACEFENWRDIYKPCESNFEWIKRSLNKTKRTSLYRSRIELISKPYGYPSVLRINTKDSLGRKKNYGGDSWMVCVKGQNYSSCFHLHDHLDGHYEGVFVMKQVGEFSMKIHLEYSLCDGLRDPPMDFFRKGNIQGRYQKMDLIGKGDEFLNEIVIIAFTVQKVSVQPNIKNIRNVSCGITMNQCGYWKEGHFYTLHDEEKMEKLPDFNLKNRPQLSNLPRLFIYGDSVSLYFFQSIRETGVCNQLFKCNNTYVWLYKAAHKEVYIFDGKEFNADTVLNDLKKDLINQSIRSNKTYFVINFGLHPIRAIRFKQAKDLFLSLLQMLRDLKSAYGDENFPNVIWKTTSPPRQEFPKRMNTLIRFDTRSRVYLWNAFTISEAYKANLPVLDIYNMALSSDGGKDDMHYKNYVFKKAEKQLIMYILNSTRRG